MFISLLSAFALLALDTQAAAPSLDNVQPLREVTYKVTEGIRLIANSESFTGMSTNQGSAVDEGTVTVGVMAVSNDALGLRVTELMNKKGHPYSFIGSVTPDGTVVFAADSINDLTRELLQYFGSHFIPSDKTIEVGTGWNINSNRGGVNVATEFKVVKVDGDRITLHEAQTVKFSASNANATTDGTIVFKPSKLVPISGDIRKTLRRVTAEGGSTQELTLHFERVADTRDSPGR